MGNKYWHRVFFTESIINNMLNKGWKPVHFKSIGCCVFQQCEPEKYTCKLVFMNRKCIDDYTKLFNQITAVKEDKDIHIIELKDKEPVVNFYYLIYEKNKKIKYKFEYFGDGIILKKALNRLMINCFGGLIYVVSFTILWIRSLNESKNLGWYIVGIVGLICGSIYLWDRIRELVITKYVYFKYFKKKIG